MKINKIYYSCQGEGIHSGESSLFIRMQGCNLETPCSWCDTLYAREGKGTSTSIQKILDKLVDLRPQTYKAWVCITGGEPLYQPEALEELVKKLHNYGFRVEIETNGTLPKPRWWSRADCWVADIKCPSSGTESLVDDWFKVRAQDQVKFVVQDDTDIDYARKIIRSKVAANPVILVSPVIHTLMNFEEGQEIRPAYYRWKNEQEWMQKVWQFCIEERVRFSLQIHKIVFGSQPGV